MSNRLAFSTRRIALVSLLSFLATAEAAADIPTFHTQEIEKSLGVGYAVLLVDVNNDGKKTSLSSIKGGWCGTKIPRGNGIP